MSPNLFRYSYYTLILLLKIIFLMVIVLFIKTSYQYYEASNIISYLKEIREINNHVDELWQIVKPWLIDFAYFIGKLIAIAITTFIIKNLPVPMKAFTSWDNNNQITPIFGRMIAQHLRTNYHVSFKEFSEIHRNSVIEEHYVTYHKKKGKISPFLEKYDINYNQDSTMFMEKQHLNHNQHKPIGHDLNNQASQTHQPQ